MSSMWPKGLCTQQHTQRSRSWVEGLTIFLKCAVFGQETVLHSTQQSPNATKVTVKGYLGEPLNSDIFKGPMFLWFECMRHLQQTTGALTLGMSEAKLQNYYEWRPKRILSSKSCKLILTWSKELNPNVKRTAINLPRGRAFLNTSRDR